MRFRVTDQEAWVGAQRMRFRDVMFDVGYRQRRESGANDRIHWVQGVCLQGVPYREGNSGRGFLHT